jgi:cytochrome c oxidase assembly protein subunit 15
MRSFVRFGWTVLAYNVAVIGWGALVRATGSGAGCGQHWPTCQGDVVPRSPALDTVIEFTHRLTSGAAFALVLVLFLWARRALPLGHKARTAAGFALGFIVLEALLGAALVLFGWVAKDTSAGRGWAMPLHLTNTFLLLASLALTAAWARRGERATWQLPRGALPVAIGISLGAVLLAGVTGAVAALGDTLHPATTLGEGLRQDFAGSANVLLKLRVLHPFAALFAGVMTVVTAWLAVPLRRDPQVARAGGALVVLVCVQLLVGVLNLVLLAPVWLQVVHLVLADLVWISLIAMGGWTVCPGEPEPAAAAPVGLRAAESG